jgi:hypothetical protein
MRRLHLDLATGYQPLVVEPVQQVAVVPEPVAALDD